MNSKNEIKKQDGATIMCLYPKNNVRARIYNEEERQEIKKLIKRNYLPHHTSIGSANASTKGWNVVKYSGRFGRGYKLITYSPFSQNFNHITYFILMD